MTGSSIEMIAWPAGRFGACCSARRGLIVGALLVIAGAGIGTGSGATWAQGQPADGATGAPASWTSPTESPGRSSPAAAGPAAAGPAAAGPAAAGPAAAGPAAADFEPTPLFGRMDAEAGRGAGRVDKAVEVDELGAVDVGSVGLIGQADGGLAADLWTGAERGPVESMLGRLPVTSTSAAVQELMRLLLLSEAAAPKTVAGRTDDPTRYVAMRIARLIDMGALEEAYDLARRLPARLHNPGLDRLRIQAGLIAGRIEAVCRDTDRAVRLYTDVFFARVQVFCETWRGDTERAFLGLSLLQETGDADPVFVGLIEKLLGGDPPAAADPPMLDPLMMRLYLAAGRPYPAPVASAGSYGYERLFLGNDLNGQETRVLVAEGLVAAGVVPPAQLRLVYNSISFTPTELSEATRGSSGRGGPRTRAAVHKAATNAGAPAQQAALIQHNLDLSSSAENYRALLLASSPMVRLLRPGDTLAWFADEAARILVYAADLNAARPWLALRASRPGSALPTSVGGEAEMPAWLLARLAGLNDRLSGWSSARLNDWAVRQRALGSPESARRLSLTLTMLRAFGEAVDWKTDALRDALIRNAGSNAASPEALALRSGSAAVKGQVGLSVLYGILAIGERGPGQSDVVVLDQVVRSLNHVGLERVARRIAVEAAVIWAR